jgi:hypothetical protein
MQQEDLSGSGKVYVKDNVMVTGNRDHPTSTMQLEHIKDDKDRDYHLGLKFFGCLNQMAWVRKCASLAKDFGFIDDMEEFKALEDEEIRKQTDIFERYVLRRTRKHS